MSFMMKQSIHNNISDFFYLKKKKKIHCIIYHDKV